MLITHQHPLNKSIMVSVLGAPNVGKSSLVNEESHLLDERCLIIYFTTTYLDVFIFLDKMSRVPHFLHVGYAWTEFSWSYFSWWLVLIEFHRKESHPRRSHLRLSVKVRLLIRIQHLTHHQSYRDKELEYFFSSMLSF